MNEALVFVLINYCLVVGGTWYSSPTKLSLVESDSGGHDFGASIAIYDSYLVVGSNTGDSNDVSNAGSVAIFTKNVTGWRRVMKLTRPSNGQVGFNFGRDIDIYESTIIVGSSRSAYVYQRNGNTWQLASELNESECATSVAVYASYCAVGCVATNEVKIYAKTSASFWNHLQTITPSENTTNRFGCDVSMYGGYLTVASSDAVRIYKRNNKIWDSHVTIYGNNICKLSMQGDRLAFVSTKANSDRSSVHIYKRTYESWSLEDRINLTISNLAISIFQRYLVVGSTDLVETDGGSARAFIYSLRDGKWLFDRNLTTSSTYNGDRFGTSVAIWYNSLFLVGGPNDDVDRGTYSGSVYVFENRLKDESVKSFSVDCTDTHVRLTWAKSLFNAVKIRIVLLDPQCNTHYSSSTHVWVERLLDECGSNITTDGDLITYSNVANVYVTTKVRSELVMESLFTYTIKCTMERSALAGSNNNADLQKTQEVEVPTTGGDPIVVSMSLAIYRSANYESLAPIPYKIASDEIVFIAVSRIQGFGNESEYVANYKFIAHSCYATSTPYANDTDTDYFLADRCVLENSFSILHQDDDHFRFAIQASTFIAFRKTVYFHCLIDICRVDAVSPQCNQSCSNSEQTSGVITDENKPQARITLTSAEIRYNEEAIVTCDGVTCVPNATCYILNAPVCICNEGFVFSQYTSVCEPNRILDIQGVHLDLEWDPVLANTSSKEFLQMAHLWGDKLYKLLKATESNRLIEGVRVIGISPGSIIFDVQVIYAAEVPKEEAFQSFVKAITEVPLTEDGGSTAGSTVHRSMNIMEGFKPYMVTDETEEKEEDAVEESIWYIPVMVVLVFFCLLCVIIIIFVVMRRRRSRQFSLFS